MRKGNLPGMIPVFLGWLCAFHPESATQFYKKVNLATDELSFRPYLKKSGSWAEIHDDKKAKNPTELMLAKEHLNLSPVIPRRVNSLSRSISTILTDGPIILPHAGSINYAEFSPCGRYIVVAGRRRGPIPPGVFIWDIDKITEASRCYAISLSAESDVRTATFSPNSRFVVWATDRKSKLSYAHALAQPVFEIDHNNKISYCSFSSDGRWIASSSWDQTVCIWDATNGRKLHTISPKIRGDHVVNSAYFTRDKTKILIACSDCTIEIWDISNKAVLSSFHSQQRE